MKVIQYVLALVVLAVTAVSVQAQNNQGNLIPIKVVVVTTFENAVPAKYVVANFIATFKELPPIAERR